MKYKKQNLDDPYTYDDQILPNILVNNLVLMEKQQRKTKKRLDRTKMGKSF
jgi:hypothetical protein